MLPWSIEAMVATVDDREAIKLHTRFLRTYHLTAAQVPLVSFHKELINCPFKLLNGVQEERADHAGERYDYHVNGVPTVWTVASPPGVYASPSAPGGEDCIIYSGQDALSRPPSPQPPQVWDWNVDRPALVIG